MDSLEEKNIDNTNNISQIDKSEEKKKKRCVYTASVPNRLLRALSTIYENDDASIEEKLQAIKLSVEVLPMRPPVKRKTDRDKAVINFLKMNTKKGEAEASPENGKK